MRSSTNEDFARCGADYVWESATGLGSGPPVTPLRNWMGLKSWRGTRGQEVIRDGLLAALRLGRKEEARRESHGGVYAEVCDARDQSRSAGNLNGIIVSKDVPI